MFPTCTHQESNSRIFMKVWCYSRLFDPLGDKQKVLLQEARILRRPGRTAHSFTSFSHRIGFFWEPPLNLSQNCQFFIASEISPKGLTSIDFKTMDFGLKSCPPTSSPIKQRKLEANIQGTYQGIHDHLSRCIGRFGSWEILIFRNLEAKF